MINQFIKSTIVFFSLSLSFQATATDTIKVTVKTNEKNAIAVGFSVDGKHSGGLGKAFSSKGPINKAYFFGYRKDSVFGENVDCGSMVLTQDSSVIMVFQDNKCTAILG